MTVAKLLPFRPIPTGDVYGPHLPRPALDCRSLGEVLRETTRPELQRLLSELWQCERYQSFDSVIDHLRQWSADQIVAMIGDYGAESEVVAMPCPKCSTTWNKARPGVPIADTPHRRVKRAECIEVPTCNKCNGTGWIDTLRVIREYRHEINDSREWTPYKRPPATHSCGNDCKSRGCGRWIDKRLEPLVRVTAQYKAALQCLATGWINGLVAQATFGVTKSMGRKSIPHAVEVKANVRQRLQLTISGRRRLRQRKTRGKLLALAREKNDRLAKSRGIVGTINGVPILIGGGTIRVLPQVRRSGSVRRSLVDRQTVGVIDL